MSQLPASQAVRRRLHVASRRLGTRDPNQAIGPLLDRSFALPTGDSRYAKNSLTPGVMPLEHSFSEAASGALRLAMEPMGPEATAWSRAQETTREVRRLVHQNYGREAMHWFDQRSEPFRGSCFDGGNRFGAWFGAGFDENGLQEVKAYYELRQGQLDTLPPNLQQAVRVAMTTLPGLVPIFTSVACRRRSGRQRVYLYHRGELRLLDIEPLMRRLGVGEQHPGVLAALGLILGGRFTLPDGSVVLGLRDTSRGMEMKLEILMPMFPDPPPQMHGLIKMYLAQRPESQRALRHWMQAMTPDDHASPGSLHVVGVRVAPHMGPLLTIYFQPVGYDRPQSEVRRPGMVGGDPYMLSA